MGELNAAITGLLIALFSTKGAALALAALILLAALSILVGVYISRVVPIRKAVTRRIVDFPRTVELADLERVSGLMSRPDKRSFALERAWAAFRSALLTTPEGQLRSGAPAWTVFNVVTSETQVLGWWSNLFVAIGLIFTFLGVVAALSEATAVLGAGSSTAAMSSALTGLLTITATKFWTSIAGIFASVVLRICERRWSTRIDEAVEDLCEMIDVRIPPVSPGMMQGEQLAEMKRQTQLLADLRDVLTSPPVQSQAAQTSAVRARAS